MHLINKKISILFAAFSLSFLFYFLGKTSEYRESRDLCPNCTAGASLSALQFTKEAEGRFTLEGAYQFKTLPKEISFVLGSYGRNVKDVQGLLTFVSEGGLECTYQPKTSSLKDNVSFLFIRGPCPEDFPLKGKMRIMLQSHELSQLALWSFPSSADKAPSEIQVCSGLNCNFGVSGKSYSGNTIVQSSIASRLAWMWGQEEYVFWAAMATAGLFLVLGLWILVHGARTHLVVAGSLFLISLGLGQLFTWLSPPLQAPDEADHLLTAAYQMAPERLVGELEVFAKRIHFERIKFRAGEKFLDEHELAAFSPAWGKHVGPVIMEGRSPVTWRSWSTLKPFLKDLKIESLLLLLRIINSLAFSLAVFIISFVLFKELQNLFFAVPLFLLPSLYFFSMHVSDHSFLTSFQTVFVSMSLALALKPNSKPIFASWVLSAGFVFATSRAGLPILVLVPALICSPDISRGFSGGRWSFRETMLRAVWLVPALWLTQTLLTESFLAGVFGFGTDKFQSTSVSQVLSLTHFFLTSSYALVTLPLLYIAAAVLSWAVAIRFRSAWQTFKRFGPLVLGALLFCSLLLPWLKPDRTIPDIEGLSRLPLLSYIKKVLHVTGGFLNFGHHDFYGVMTFFGGYGWLETIPSQAYVSGLIAILVAGILCSAVFDYKRRENSTSMVLCFLFGMGLISLTLNTAANYFVPQNLHGRYLIGYFLLVSFVCSAGFRHLERFPKRAFLPSASPSFIVLSALNYAYVFQFLLNRYFSLEN